MARYVQAIAPTLAAASKKHGGPDLGPTRAKKQWELLGVDGWVSQTNLQVTISLSTGDQEETITYDCAITGIPR